MGPIEEDLIAWILREVLKGLNYLHSQRIAYGNMTSHDILFSVNSGSFEIKLNHSHAVVDELDDRTASNGSETSFNRNMKVSTSYIDNTKFLKCTNVCKWSTG